MPLRFQNVCRHRQTNNTSRLPPILTPHALFSHFPAPLLSNFPAFPENLLPAVSCRPAPHTLFPHLSCPASFKLSRLSRKSPAGRFMPPRTAHVVSSPFLPRFFQTFPPFPKISCRPFHAAPHRTRCFLTFPAPLLSNFPAFPENLLPAVSCRPAPHTLFPHLSCRASFKLSRLSRKSPAGRFMPPRTAHVVSSPFLPRFFQTFPPFPKISCRPSSADPHTAHVVFSLSCPASFKLSRLSRKSPAGRFTPPRTAHVVFSLSCRASLKFAYLSRKSPAGRFTPPRTARVVSLLSGPVHRSPA